MADYNFTEIPQTGWDLPRTAVEVRPNYSNVALAAYPTKTVIFGVMIAGSPGAPNVPFRVTRLADVTARAGAGSIAEDMAADFINGNPFNELWMVLVPEASGATKATGGLVYTGAPSGAGTLTCEIAGRRVTINTTTSDTPTTIAKARRDAINAIPNMPVVASWASGATGTCTLTAKHAADLGNDITILQNTADGDAPVPGITESVTAMSGGAGAVDLTAAIAACASTWYAYMVLPCSDATNMGLITAELTRRYAATGHLDCLAFGACLGTLTSLAAYGPARNSQFLSMLAAPVLSGVVTREPRWRLAAMYAAQATYYLSDDPSRQLKSLVLKGMKPPIGGDFIDPERNILVRAGMTTFEVTAAGTCALEKAVTTCTLDGAGVPTTGWQDIMAPAVASRIRYDFRTYKALNYPRAKLALDGSAAADSADVVITIPSGLLGIWAARAKIYESLGWIVDLDATLKLCRAQMAPDGSRNHSQARFVYRRIDNDMLCDVALEFLV